MPLTFEEVARRENVWLRGFLMGPTGSGKSRGALELASRVFGGELKMTLINTEKGRGKLYADRFPYQLIELDGDFGPEAYIQAIDLAEEKNPGGVMIVDSVSHEWMGANGVLQQADRFGEWKTVRPKHNAFVDRLLAVEGHVIVCCRAKMKYDVGEEEVGGRKRQVITMLGVGPVQSDDLQYEFNFVARFEQATKLAEFSGHVDSLQGVITSVIDDGADMVAAKLTEWCSEGEPPAPPEAAEEKAIAVLRASLLEEGFNEERIETGFTTAKRLNRGKLHPEYVATQTKLSQERLATKAKPAAAPKAEMAKEEKPAAAANGEAPAAGEPAAEAQEALV